MMGKRMDNDDDLDMTAQILRQAAWPSPSMSFRRRVLAALPANEVLDFPAFLAGQRNMAPLRASLLGLTIAIGFGFGVLAQVTMSRSQAAEISPLYAGSGVALAQLFSNGGNSE